MIKEKTLKKITMIVLVCIFVIGSTVMVLAATTYSGWKAKTVYGKTYNFRSVCLERYLTTGNTLESVIEINSSYVPTGYIGAQAYLCDEYDNLVTQSPMTYNTNLTNMHFVNSPSITADGYYYAWGLVRFYNGDGYTVDYTYSTPMASITSNGLQTERLTNSGYNYSKILGEDVKMPEMVPVKKADGTTGFVRFEDISPEANTIEEALEITERAAYDQIVPMYNEDGEIIGEWIIPAMNQGELTEIVYELGY